MDRAEEKKLAHEVEREMRDDASWEALPDQGAGRRDTLASQVTVRLGPEDAAKLRRIAEQAGIGYTSLLRRWVVERLLMEEPVLISGVRLQQVGIGGTQEFTYQTPANRIAVEAA